MMPIIHHAPRTARRPLLTRARTAPALLLLAACALLTGCTSNDPPLQPTTDGMRWYLADEVYKFRKPDPILRSVSDQIRESTDLWKHYGDPVPRW